MSVTEVTSWQKLFFVSNLFLGMGIFMMNVTKNVFIAVFPKFFKVIPTVRSVTLLAKTI